LADAHRLGIVHRDLKPSNLLLSATPDGAELVKVTDFGIAKLPPAANTSTLTEETGVLGSPRYMSPEQILDPRTVDARSDLWSLGVVLYELVSSKLPFEAYTTSGLFARIASEPAIPLRERLPSVAPEFEAVVMRCLAKLPSDRFADVTALAEALAPLCENGDESAARVRRIASQSEGDSRESSIRPAAVEAETAASLTAAPTEQPITPVPRKSRIGYFVVAAVLVGGALGVRALTKTTAAAAPAPSAVPEAPVVSVATVVEPPPAPAPVEAAAPVASVVVSPPMRPKPKPSASAVDIDYVFGPRK
jgi:serine/threonine-protein kinase